MKKTLREYALEYIEETEHQGPEWPLDKWEAAQEGIDDFVLYVEVMEEEEEV
jgi:hypothetical protein